MNTRVKAELEALLRHHPALGCVEDSITKAYELMRDCFSSGGRLYLCGNGGSASDCEHMVAELMKGFKLPRKLDEHIKRSFKSFLSPSDPDISDLLQGALPAISLPAQTAISTAYINDVQADMLYAQLVYGYGCPGDILLGISTSGNSQNVINAVITAKCQNMKVITFTGQNGGKLATLSDCCLAVPAFETYRVQEYHLPVYHCLCAMLEVHFFGT